MSAPRPSVRQRFRDEGLREVARSYASDRWTDLVRFVAHRRIAPRISELYARAAIQTTDPGILLARIPAFPTSKAASFDEEYREVTTALDGRYRSTLAYPTVSALSGGESRLVYSLVRGLAPEQVFETGVANGHSSCLILEALRRNGSGTLRSVDVRPDVGQLVPPELRSRWELRILSRRSLERDLRREFDAKPSIDLFIHDSDHSYRWQTLELSLAWPRLSPKGVLASDDVDWSYAFLDFGRTVGQRPGILVSEKKAFGLLTKTGPL